jgi:hypothetical protein
LVERHIELRDGLLTEYAVGLKTMAALKVLYSVDYSALVDGAVGGHAGVGRQIAK